MAIVILDPKENREFNLERFCKLLQFNGVVHVSATQKVMDEFQKGELLTFEMDEKQYMIFKDLFAHWGTNYRLKV